MTNTENNLENTPLLSNVMYDRLTRLVQNVLPAGATLYYTLSVIFDFGGGEQVVAAAAAVATFLGILLVWSNKSYEASGKAFDGTINVETPTPDSTVYSLELKGDPAELRNMDAVSFKVNNPGN